jgi:DNA helicase IV
VSSHRTTGTRDPSPADSALSQELSREQGYLAAARRHLARMRERTLSLRVQGGDRVSSEYLAATLWRRAASLVDDPLTALFFGRTDHTDGSRWYIGRRHVADENGDPVVVDWRAEICRPFYRASRREPMGVARRRRFGVESGKITAYEDEHLTDPTEADRHSAILAREIERPRIGPMRDIVATIQPEQDEIVRADLGTSICVQGAPGTGKTAVGLHRAAWLLYAHRDRLSRTGALVVGPSASFLRHIAAVLPSLGELDVAHTTVDRLVAARPARGRDEVSVATLKGDARMAGVLRRAVWSQVLPATEALVLPRGVRRWRLPAHQVAEIVDELRGRGVRYGAARAMLPRRLAHAVLVLMEAAGESPDDRVQDAVARSREVKRYVDAVWPQVRPERLLRRLLTEPDLLARSADGLLTDDEQLLLVRARAGGSPAALRWSPADLVLLDELADLVERTPSLGHVVLDEAQDLSAMQLRAVGRRCSTGSATVLGDLAQGTTPWATRSWPDALGHLGQPQAVVDVLDRGFRVPAAVIDFAARLLPVIAPDLRPPTSVREDPGSLALRRLDRESELWPGVLAAVADVSRREGSIGVIVPDAWAARADAALRTAAVEHEVLSDQPGPPPDDEPRVSLVPATLAKGLEYDHVIVAEPAAIVAAEPDRRTGLRRLYVVLTRAVTSLTVVHATPLPPPLAG